MWSLPEGWRETRITLPDRWHGRAWRDVLTGESVGPSASIDLSALPLPWGVLLSR